MESSQPKRQKGIKSLWARLKALLRPKPSSPATKSESSAFIPNTTSQTKTQNKENLLSTIGTMPQSKNLESEQVQPSQPTQQPTDIRSQPHEDIEKPPKIFGVIEVDNDDSLDQDVYPLPDYSRPRLSSIGADPVAQRAEIAKDIYSRYGLKLEATELKIKPTTQIERVERKARMRVRWTCHECKSTFGREKNCPKCTHWRCADCSRYPPKKAGERVRRTPAKTMPVTDKIQQPTTGACHECKTTFDFPAAQCENCQHQICERCIKESIEEAPLATQVAATT